MFGKRVTLFRLLGFAVRVDISWIFIAALVSWSLADEFRGSYEDLAAITYWLMAVAGMVGLFLSIIFHELSHSLMARRHGIEMSGITLFIFGGVAEMTEEPPNARAEFLMAAVGPLSSLGLAAGFWALTNLGRQSGWGVPVTGLTHTLAFLNASIAAFNLVPGFPLDGGRILRAALWGWKKNLRWATRWAARMGTLFAYVLIAWGVFLALVTQNAAGLWYALIGMFLRGAARSSYRQLLLRRALEGEPVRRFMQDSPTTVPPEATLAELVDQYVYRYMYKMYPVVAGSGVLCGCVTTHHVKQIPREEWRVRRVGEIMQPCSTRNSVSPDTDALVALQLMNHYKSSRLLVVEGGRLAGILALKDLLRFLSLKVALEGDGGPE